MSKDISFKWVRLVFVVIIKHSTNYGRGRVEKMFMGGMMDGQQYK